MKIHIALLCLLLGTASMVSAQLVKKGDMKKYVKQANKNPIVKGLPPVSFPGQDFNGEIKKYYPTDKYNRDNMMRDTLFYNEKAILIYQSPLLDFTGITDSLIRERESKMLLDMYTSMGFITCKREFTAQWLIRNDSLFVGSLTQQGAPLELDTVFWASLPPEKRVVFPTCNVLQNRLEQVTGIQYSNDGWMFAGWVTGKIVGGADGIYLVHKYKILDSPYYIDYTGHYIYPEEYWFEVENGIVKKIEIKTL